MAGLGDLVVNLSANTQKFDKNISKSQTGLKSFGTMAMSAINPVTAALATMTAGAIGLGAAIWGLEGNINKLDAVAKTAARTGLDGAFLQQLEFAADQSGVSAETLTKSIGKLTVQIGEAADGSKTAAEAFSRIGISVKDLQELSPQQQFERVAQSISKLPTAADRAAAAVKIFGKSGLEMVTLLNGGVDGLNGLLARAKELGIGVDAKGLRQIEAANDAIGQMKASFGALVDQVTVGLAPAFTSMASAIADMIPATTKLFETFNNLDNRWTWASDTLVAAFDVGIETIKVHWAEMLEDLIDGVVNFGVDIKDIGQFQFDITNPLAMGWDMGNKPPREQGLQAAQNRLAGLMGRFQDAGGADGVGADPGFNRPWMELKPPKSFTDAWTDITDALSPITSSLEMGATGFIDRAKIQAEATGNMLSNWLSTPAEKKLEPKLAGAMQAGSVEAYSTLVQAMMTRGKDPVVAATEKQTKDLINGLKPKREFKNIESFVSL